MITLTFLPVANDDSAEEALHHIPEVQEEHSRLSKGLFVDVSVGPALERL